MVISRTNAKSIKLETRQSKIRKHYFKISGMKCIIIDDDPTSRQLIESYIERTGTLSLSESFDNAVNALQKLKANEHIDLLFLDIMMPQMTGMQLLKVLKGNQQVIVISGKKEFALETFNYDVTDYLLKPITYERFFKAVEKAYERHYEQHVAHNREGFLVKTGLSFRKVSYSEIHCIENTNNNVLLWSGCESIKILDNFDDIAQLVPKKHFCRPHQDFIVNLLKLNHIEDNCIVFDMNASPKIIPLTLIDKQSLIDLIEKAKS